MLDERFGSSAIWAEVADLSYKGMAGYYNEFEPEPDSIILYHASVGTAMAGYLQRVPVPVVIDYHNVTPMHFFAAYEPRVAALLYAGRAECEEFADLSPLGIADSDYSAGELAVMGFRRTATVPILLDFDSYAAEPDGGTLEKLEATKKGTDILFVGRVSPQKRHEDLIKAFAVFKRHFDPGARLLLVGTSSSDRYLRTLRDYVARLGIDDVIMSGEVSFAQLLAYYRAADVYLSMSEHEGFCVPILEAMMFDIPIVAYSAAAVPETLGEAGILVEEKNYEKVAALIELVRSDEDLRRQMAQAGRKRLEHFRPERHEGRLVDLLSSVSA